MIVRESISFQRGLDPKKALVVGQEHIRQEIRQKINDEEWLDDFIQELDIKHESAMAMYLQIDKMKELAVELLL
jgi:hypothetical protein